MGCVTPSQHVELKPAARQPQSLVTGFIQRVARSIGTGNDKDLLPRRANRSYSTSAGLARHLCRSAERHPASSGGAVKPARTRSHPLPLAYRHATGVHRDDLVVEPGKAPLVLGDQDRCEAAVAVARDLHLKRAVIG